MLPIKATYNALTGLLFALILFASPSLADTTAKDISALINFCDQIRDAEPPSRKRIAKAAQPVNKAKLRAWLEARNEITIKDAADLKAQWRSMRTALSETKKNRQSSLVKLGPGKEQIVSVNMATISDELQRIFPAAVSCMARSYEWIDLETQQSLHANNPVVFETGRSRYDKYDTSFNRDTARSNRDLSLGPLALPKSRDIIRVGSARMPNDPSIAITWIEVTLYPNATLN